MNIRLDDLSGADVQALLQDHLDQMESTAPPESRHALDLTGLKQPDVSFYALRIEDQLAGCGAIKQIDETHGELKSMKTASKYLRQGVGAQMLSFLIEEGKRTGLTRLSLETGSMSYFEPAHALYKKYGFVECPPFGDYQDDPMSFFMTLAL
jgi:putative acetyltransferase